ncbi:glycosyltransferase family 2 protein [Devosia algicola]|uniref:Glycosyltransferase family 2 protein n=1 Tax=Devosia algicola TaxID=3026418 RepID=A0ABY7YR57_9HYPH|nr:glycosyltransferase [Devosia algicola]WDR03535.1 glycosyltransferase family 2 protein [Devosia algicola]
MRELAAGLVHIRTPTYRRPTALRRALDSMIAQTWQNWVCDVYDDDPDQAGRTVCEAINDPRVHYNHNVPQRFASRNIDGCFTAENPRHADYFCVVEDDNFLLPSFCAKNISLCRGQGVEIVLRNQSVEQASGTDQAQLSESGVLDELFVEARYEPDQFRLSLMVGIGVSNGGLFWSNDARSQLEIQYACTATLQEYLRTFSIVDPVYVAMTPLAVWAENAEQTTRNAELSSSYLRRELDLKRSIQALQRQVWHAATPAQRAGFMTNPLFAAVPQARARGMAKAMLAHPNSSQLPLRDDWGLRGRGLAIRLFGRITPEFTSFVQERGSASPTP